MVAGDVPIINHKSALFVCLNRLSMLYFYFFVLTLKRSCVCVYRNVTLINVPLHVIELNRELVGKKISK